MAARGVAALVFAVVFAAAFGQSSTRAANGQTIVSITFDDGVSDQILGLPILKAKHMVATYYLNSARIGGDPAYLTWNQVAQLSAAGNEIGGHTSYHEDLTAIDPVEAQREICYDRVNLIAHGYNVTDFAYPFGDNNAQIQGFVQQCGYATGRTVQDFPSAPFSGTNNPPNPYALQIGTASSTISALEQAVTLAEQNGGGWVPLVFHHICNSCDPDYITQGDFQTFINWLDNEVQAGRVATQTVQQFLGGTFNPPVAGPSLPAAVNGANGLKNSSLELDVNGDQTPDCWNFDDFGNNTFKWTRTTDAHSGTYGENLVVTNYVDGDNKLDGVTDLGFCEPTVTPGHQYLITEWYKSSTPTYFTVFSRADTSYQQNFWTSSPTFPAASTWTKASWVTPAIPAGVNGINFGLTLGGNGSLTVDDISLTDNNQTSGPDTTAPTVSMTSPSAGLVSGNVTISASASDNVAVDHLDFLVDGNAVGSTMIPPYSFNWNSHSISNGAHSISVRAVDTSGNARTTTPVTVTVSNQNTNLLQNPGLESGSGNTPTCWQLAGYGTNTAAWTWTNDSHSGNAAENLNISAYTNGDRKLLTQFNSCSVAVIPGHSYTVSAWYKAATAKPSIFSFLSSTGPTGAYNFLANSPQQPVSANWTQATWSTPVMPAGATNLSIGLGLTGQAGSVTMDDFSMTDNAPPPDTTAPTSQILCNGGGENSGCQTGFYNAPVQVTLSASDNNGGSGVNKIVYTTDGSTPTASNGSTYTGGFVVPTTATIKFRAIDNAGNLEAVNSQLIQIDTTSPTATIQCNGNGCSSFFSTAVSVTLSMADTGGSGNGEIFYTTDGTDPSPSNGNFYLGSFSVSQSSTVKFISYDAAGNESQIYSQAIQVDTTAPVSVIRCGGVACQPLYNAPVLVSFNSSDAGSGVSAVFYTTDGTTPTQSNGNVYLGPFSLSASATVRYRALDNAGNLEPVNAQTIAIDSAPPTASLTAPTAGSSLRGTVSLTASASDDVAVARVDFLVDGTVVGTASASPYTISWNSATVADGTHTLDARATDTAGNQTTSSDVSVITDQTAPSSTISCNGGTCQASAYGSAVTVSLAATDPTPGSGLAAIVYTTDGSDPTLANGNFYTAPFTVATTKTVKFRSFDIAGNAEAVQTQTITVAQETVTLTSPADGSTVDGTSVQLAATDTNGTPDHVDFLVDGTVVGTASAAPYTFSWDSTTVEDGQHTVKAEAVTGTSTVDSATATVNVSNINPPPPDTTPPTSTILCNGAACQIDPAYTNPVSVALAATDNPGGSGVSEIVYTTDGTEPTLTNGTVYSAPFSVQTTTTIEYRSYDVAGNQEATNIQAVNIDLSSNGINLTAPSTGDVLSGTVPLSATVTGLTPDRVDFLVDGTVVGSAATAPYTINWNSTTVADGQHQIKAQAVVGATTTDSNTAAVTVQNITPPPPDTTPPSSEISCNFLACTSGFYASAVSVTLTATDNAGGSGVSEIRYTTDGSTPTATHGRVYGGSFSVPATGTVLYRAFDNAGNAEAVNSQWIEVDTTAPSSSVKCNSTTCLGTFYSAPVQISLTGSDNSGGSGLNEIVYTTDGSDPTASNGTVYSAPFTLSASADLRYRAIDNVGNLEPVNSAQLQIDVTAPTTSILCAGNPCTTGAYQTGLQVSFSASDGAGGSGVAQTRYTTNGTVPTKTTGQIYSGPFAVAATTTFHFRSYDVVGNLEADNVVQVLIDGTPPTVTLTSPAANSLAAGQVTLSANASDNLGVSKVDFLVDGNVVGTATSAPYSYSWASGSVSDGVHTVAARATDGAGNTTTTATVNVTTTNTNLLQNPGLETGSGNTPTCWVLAGYGTNTPTWTWTTDAHTGAKAENLTVTGYTNGDRKMLQAFNATCATATSAGHQYTVTVWYKSTAAATIFEFGSTTGATGAYNWMAQSPVLPVAANWTFASWTTPVVPANFTNISIGMGMQNAGSLTMDDFGLFQIK